MCPVFLNLEQPAGALDIPSPKSNMSSVEQPESSQPAGLEIAILQLRDPDSLVRLRAALSLRAYDDDPTALIEPLVVAMVTDSDDHVRLFCSVAISEMLRKRGTVERILPETRLNRVVDLLCEALHLPNDGVKYESASILSYFGGHARKAVEDLIRLGERGGKLKSAAVLALGGIMDPGERRALGLILSCTSDASVGTRSVAYQALARLRDVQSEEIRQVLIAGLADEAVSNRIHAARALMSHGMVPDELRKALFSLSSQPEKYQDIAQEAAELLNQLDSRADSGAPLEFR